MQIVQYRKIYFFVSFILLLGSLFGLLFWGLKWGIDFTGGTLMEIEFLEERPDNQQIQEELVDLELGQINFQPTGQKGLILRLKDVDEQTHQMILSRIGLEQITEKRFESIGPLIGQELKRKAVWAIGLALFFIVIILLGPFVRFLGPLPLGSMAWWLLLLCSMMFLLPWVFSR